MSAHLTTSAAATADDRGELVNLVACLGNAIQAEPEAFYERPLQAWPEWISEQGFDSQCLIDWVNAAAQTNNLSTTQLHQFYAEHAKSGSTTASFLAQLHERSPQFVEALRASMQELGEEAESLQQVAGGTSALKGHPGAKTAIGVVVGTAFFLGVDHFFNKGRVRKYLFETSKDTGEAGNIAQDGEQVVLQRNQQLIVEAAKSNSSAIENSQVAQRQRNQLFTNTRRELQEDATDIREVKNDPKRLVREANQKLEPGEMNKFLGKVAKDDLDALERASWNEISSDENIAIARRALNRQVEESLAKIKQIDEDISEILLKVDPEMNSVKNIAQAYEINPEKADFDIRTSISIWGRENPDEFSEVFQGYKDLMEARKDEKYLVEEATKLEKMNKIPNADLYKQYYRKVISDNPIAKQELLDEEEAKAAKAAENQIEGEANQVISTDVLNMAEKVIKGDGIEAVNAAEQAVSKELKIEVEEIEDEMESAVEKEEDKVISNLV